MTTTYPVSAATAYATPPPYPKPDIVPYTSSTKDGAGPAIVRVAIALTLVGTILLLLRVYTRLFVLGHRKPGWSLSFAVVAWLFGLITSVLWALCTQHGFGKHYWLVESRPDLWQALVYEWTAAALSLFAAWFGKASALMYILDVQGPVHRWRKRVVIGIVGINLLLYIILIPVIFLQCNPPKDLFDFKSSKNCMAGRRTFIFATVIGTWGAFTDLVLALYPTVILWSVQIKRQLKAALCVIMGLGVFTAVCAVLKTYLFCAFQATQTDSDPTYDNAGFVFWSIIELWVILLAACVPPLWPLARSIGRCSKESLPSYLPILAGKWSKSSGSSHTDGGSMGRFGISHDYKGKQSEKSVFDGYNTTIYGGAGNGGSDGSDSERSAARRYFYEYGGSEKNSKAETMHPNTFGEWAVKAVASRAPSEGSLRTEDGIRVTRNVLVRSVYEDTEKKAGKPV